MVETENVTHQTEDPQQSSSPKLTIAFLFSFFTVNLIVFTTAYLSLTINTPKETIMHCNQTDTFFKPCLGVNDNQWSVIVGAYFLGGFVGTSTTQLVERFIQPLHYLWALNFLIFIGIFLMTFFSHFIIFAFGRFFVGIAAGASWTIAPIYSSDTTHKSFRGSFGVVISLIAVLSVILSQVLGVVFSFNPGWRIYIGLAVITVSAQLLLLPFVKKSPRLLIISQKFEEAEQSLFALRGTVSHEEFEEMKKDIELEEEKAKKFSFWKKISNKKIIKSLCIIMFLQGIQSFTGSVIVSVYTTIIFEQAGVPYPSIATIGNGIFQLISLIISISVIDKIGRRKLLLIGTTGQTIFFIIFSLSFMFKTYMSFLNWFCVIGVIGYIFFYCLAHAPLPVILSSELVPEDLEDFAMGLGNSFSWGSSFLTSITFSLVNQILGLYTFIPFMICNIITIIFVFIFVPETKGKSMEELTKEFSYEDTEDLHHELHNDDNHHIEMNHENSVVKEDEDEPSKQ